MEPVSRLSSSGPRDETYNLAEIARLLGYRDKRAVVRLIKAGQVPPPDFVVGQTHKKWRRWKRVPFDAWLRGREG